ncbi:hypothetical protein C474_07522 [Halogeometricum pallidum JCM 14848]|uniref:Secreted glycoprotein n=1 Tax=Halogeometricum pallidum JCM 14848 TaxID=1227487 RepID=M0DER8_HALPD|nr:hypothetical protein [Halogeometricum pallidum]ELZ32649.1 hypothetical protein C474_07522 [Halogeometricum pallidum JCM 14848]
MQHRELSVLMAALFVTSLATGLVTATPPRPGTEDNGLSENESATLWSRDTDNYTSQEAYRQRYGDERTAIHQLANGSDITFKRPPATAATWTRNDFEDLEAGGSDMSVHPPHASLEDGVFIEDAHATVFAVQPSTHGHLESGETPLYIAPNGTIRGFVDYRVRLPNEGSSDNRTVEWSLAEHGIKEVRLQKDGETIARMDGSHTPVLDYQIDDDWSATLSLEAEIHVRLKKTIQTDGTNGTDVEVVYREEARNVSDSIDVEIYDLSAYPYDAEYPNGDAGVAIFQSRPWQGYTLSEDGNASVRGVWRFYTARNTNWDTLVRSNRTDSAEVESDAIPVYVHAYPSRIGPRAEPVRDGPEIIDTWGTERPSPKRTIGENVTVEIVNQSYETTYGVAVRAASVDREALHVAGIVRGVNASIAEPDGGSGRQLRRSNLTVEVLQQNQSQATVRIELRDNETGAPVVLNDDTRRYLIGESTRNGYITVADQEVETNASGVAIVTITDPGIYTARYHPGSWLGHNPAYVSDTATARWHPLGSIDGWFALVFEAGWQFIPFFVVFYAGRRLLRMLGPADIFQ